jgi:major intracellular serine protease
MREEIISKVSLIPYEIQEVTENVNEVPDGVKMINAPDIWNDNKGESVVIAVIDTGIDKYHPDLMKSVIGGYNFTTADPNDYQDRNGHGTHVAGTIAAIQNNIGVVGVAPECKLLILKALNDAGTGYSSWIVNAINYATDWVGPNNEKVTAISMSLGGPDDVTEHEAIIRAIEHDILVICAAGNEGDNDFNTDEMAYPAAYPEVISVGAVDFNNIPATFTNTNEEVDLVAPGVDVVSTYLEGSYARLSGTSMATPHVAGATALLKNKLEKEFERKLTEAELYAQLCKHTRTLNLDRRIQGNGVLDLTAVPSPPAEQEPEPIEAPPTEEPKEEKKILLSVKGIDAPIKVNKHKHSVSITWRE